MSVVRPEQAGVGSAVNDATRLVGGTLGVAIIGSTFASISSNHIDAAGGLTADIQAAARDNYPATHAIASTVPTTIGRLLTDTATNGFLSGLHAGCGICAAIALLGVGLVLAYLPAHPQQAGA